MVVWWFPIEGPVQLTLLGEKNVQEHYCERGGFSGEVFARIFLVKLWPAFSNYSHSKQMLLFFHIWERPCQMPWMSPKLLRVTLAPDQSALGAEQLQLLVITSLAALCFQTIVVKPCSHQPSWFLEEILKGLDLVAFISVKSSDPVCSQAQTFGTCDAESLVHRYFSKLQRWSQLTC